MKTPLIALATIILGLGSALGQSIPEVRFEERAAATDLRASALLGATVYRTDTAQLEVVVDGVHDDWESVASVDDVLVSHDGELQGVLLDVGGFLGIGARTVMVPMDSLQVVLQRDSDVVHVLVSATREQLEGAPEFDVNTIASQGRSDFQGRVGAPAGPVVGYEIVEATELTADDLTGAVVYDRFGDRVSGISDVVLSADGGSVEGVVVDVGGFLGLFAHSVVVGLDQLVIHQDAQSDAVRVYLDLTQEELENLPAHEG